MTARRDSVADLLAQADAALLRLDWSGVARHSAAILSQQPAHEIARRLHDLAVVREDPSNVRPLRPPVAGERRHVAVMFCDLVDSVGLAERNDPEQLRDVLLRYHAVCADVIRRYDGHIARIVGDALLVYFGYPRVEEDTAYRAVLAGLEIAELVASTDSTNDADRGARRLQVRVGVHTGLAVISDLGSGEWQSVDEIIGVVPNIAARLQGLAEPGTVIISQAVQELVSGRIQVAALGVPPLRGVTTPVAAYRAEGPTTATSRFRADASNRIPYVGRDLERARLRELIAVGPGRPGHTVRVLGEAGVGKSRIVEEVRIELEGRLRRLEGACSPFTRDRQFAPIVQVIQQMAAIEPWDDGAITIAKLRRALLDVGRNAEHTLPLVAAILGVPPDGEFAPMVDTPQRVHQASVAALWDWITSYGRQAATLLWIEDVHWADPSTLELLQEIASARSEGLGMILTARADQAPPWQGPSEDLVLSALPEGDCAELIRGVPGAEALSAEDVALVAQRSDGIPLFLEQCTRMLTASHAQHGDRIEGLDIPPTLRDLLLARFDRLGPAKGLAQVAASLGREVRHDVLAATLDLTPADLDRALEDLVAAHIIEVRGFQEYRLCRFRHALLQETAYQSQLLSRRVEVHRRIANVLREQFPEVCEAEPHVLARHLEEAGDAAGAIGQWRRAGQREAATGAHAEAVAHFRHAIALLERDLPADATRAQTELPLRLLLGGSLANTFGYGFPAVAETFGRAHELCVALGQPPELVEAALHGLWTYYITRADFVRANELAAVCLERAERVGSTNLRVLARAMVGGQFAVAADGAALRAALGHLDTAISLYEREPEVTRFVTSLHPVVQALLVSALELWHLGSVREAEERAQRAIDFAGRETGVLAIVSRAYALTYRAYLLAHSAEPKDGLDAAREAGAFCQQHAFAAFVAAAGVFEGRALTRMGDLDAGPSLLARSLAGYQRTGARLYVPEFLGFQAEAQLACGDAVAAKTTVEAALTLATETGDAVPQAELLRLRGEIGMRAGRHDRAAEDLARALELSQRREELSDELRVAMTVVRCASTEAARHVARERLSTVLARFGPDQDGPDLTEARALAASQ